jgi:hypothetical protein
MPIEPPQMSKLPQMSQPMSQPLDPNLFKRQLGGKKYKNKTKLTKKKKRHIKKSRKHHH